MSERLTDEEIDERLRRPARDAPVSEIDDGLLRAYLAGTLGEAETEQVERALIDDADARATLRALAEAETALNEIDFARAERVAAGQAPSRGRRAAWTAGLGAVLAMAAGLMLWFGRTPAPEGAWRVDGPHGGVQQARADTTTAGGVFLPHSDLRLDLLPEVERPADDRIAPIAPMAVHVYRTGPAGLLVALPDAVVVQRPSGAIRVSGKAGALLGPGAGRHSLWVALGEGSGDLGGQTEDAATAALPGGRLHRIQIDYRDSLEDTP